MSKIKVTNIKSELSTVLPQNLAKIYITMEWGGGNTAT